MNPSTKKRLQELDAKLGKTVEFAVYGRQEEDKPSMLKRAAIAAGAGAAAYGGLAYLRGRAPVRAWQTKVLGAPTTGVKGVMDAIKAGHNMNKADVGSALNKVGQSATAAGQRISATVNPLVEQGRQAAASASQKVSTAVAPVAQRVSSAMNPMLQKGGQMVNVIRGRLFRGRK
jgi:hypothetical protein